MTPGEQVSILDADTGLAYLAAVIESDIALVAHREVAAAQLYAAGHRDGVEQTLHKLRREVQHVQAMAEAIRRGTVIPLVPVPSGDRA